MLAQIETLSKLAENGIIAAAFLYILYWLLNKQSREVAEQSRRAQMTNIEVASSIRTLANAVSGMQQQLLMHDLTVSGLNPDAGGTFEERDSLAYKKYQEVMSSIEEQQEFLKRLNQEADQRIARLRPS